MTEEIKPDDKELLDWLDTRALNLDDLFPSTSPTRGRAVLFFAPYDGDRPPTFREAVRMAMRKANVPAEFMPAKS